MAGGGVGSGGVCRGGVLDELVGVAGGGVAGGPWLARARLAMVL